MTQMNGMVPSMNSNPGSSTVLSENPESTLYVGDLDVLASEHDLMSFFSKETGLISVKVCRDTIRKISLGYAYVNFRTADEARKAMENLNFSPIRGKPCRIMISHRDPTIRKSGRGNLFVKNLDKSLDVKSLYKSFGYMGKILSFKLATDESGRSKGFGFIHYEDESVVEMVISKLNGKVFQGKKLYVSRFVSKKERLPDGLPVKFNNLFVKNFDEAVTDDKLLEFFSGIGPIISAKVMRNEDGTSKMFGFVCFQEFDDAATAVETMKTMELSPGKKLFIGRAMKKSERVSLLKVFHEERRQERNLKYHDCNVYIKNLVETIDDERLNKEFSQFGTITSAKIMRDEKGVSKGFGFVCFEQSESAKKAIQNMNKVELDGKRIYVGMAQTKEARHSEMLMKHATGYSGIPANQIMSSDGMFYHIRPHRFAAMPPYPGAPNVGMSFPVAPMLPNTRRFSQVPHMERISQQPQYRSRQIYNPRVMSGMAPNMHQQNGNPRRFANYMNNGQPVGTMPRIRMQGYSVDTMNTMNNQNVRSIAPGTIHSGSIIRPNIDNQMGHDHPTSPAVVGQSDGEFLRNINIDELAKMETGKKKAILGEVIYKAAEKHYGDKARKIAGVLLASNTDLLSKLHSEEALLVEIKAVYQALMKNAEAAAAAAQRK